MLCSEGAGTRTLGRKRRQKRYATRRPGLRGASVVAIRPLPPGLGNALRDLDAAAVAELLAVTRELVERPGKRS